MSNRERMATETLQSLLDSKAPIARIAAWLDELSHAARVEETRALNRASQRALWNRAPNSGIELTHFVPASVPPLAEVIHFGRNTLPLPGPFKVFEKRFCAPQTGRETKLFGFNHGITLGWVGPGFFVLRPTLGNRLWEERAALVVDYFEAPDGPVAPGWPKVILNDEGLQRLVYFHTRDFMRKVSAHVSIGSAHKEEKPLDHYFTLVRQDG